jgi:putative phage-type endonuclease
MIEFEFKWLEERRRGIGGSDAPAVLGLSKWKTPYQVYLDKIGEGKKIEDNPGMEWGRRLESAIIKKYCDETGHQVFVPGETKILVHPVYDFMLASLDGLVDAGRVLEAKTARSSIGWGEPGTDEIPEIYQVQVHHYMAVTGLKGADIPVLIGGSDFRIYHVERDDELIDILIEQEAMFWERVQKKEPPEATSLTDVMLKFGNSTSKKVQCNDDVLTAVNDLKRIKGELSVLKKIEEDLKLKIFSHMGDADTLLNNDAVLATWKSAKGSKRFDAKAFQCDQPELYEKYMKVSEPSRRFLIK